jgi:zinc D-Ala-D-Ala carboxypeptidase
MNLSPHFTLSEFTHSNTAIRAGISNEPDEAILIRLKRVAAMLEQVRALLGKPITITSGYRSPALNDLVPGSSDTSAHTQGWAVDFKVQGMTPLEVCRAVMKSGIKYDQIILEYDAWTHISIDPRMRSMELTKRNGTPYQQGIIP